jgi:SPP1 gp7 family putative phage head morphogenesis protein
MTNIKNIKYWEMREARNMYKDMQLAEDCAKELSVIYSKAAIYTAKQIEGIFNRFASKHHLTRDEAINLLSEADSKDFEKLLEAYKNKTGAKKREVLAELEAPAYKNRMKRLDDINKSINKLINAIASKERNAIDKTMRKVYESSYHHAVYEAARMSGLDLQTGPIDEGALETILKKKWSGQNYSERVWNNTQKVADALKEEFMIGALTGKTEKEMTDSINEQFLSGRNNARRLVRTESSYIHNEAHFQAYKDYGIEEYRFVATLDLRTSQICRERDGSVYRVNDKKIGVNAPPMHPWCRSTTIMNLDDETMHNLERFARDPVTGERMKVPADETYKEWHQRMVEKHGAEAINTAEKSAKNYSSDKKQQKKYRSSFDKENMSLSQLEFQKSKNKNKEDSKNKKKEVLKNLKTHVKAASASVGQDKKVPVKKEENTNTKLIEKNDKTLDLNKKSERERIISENNSVMLSGETSNTIAKAIELLETDQNLSRDDLTNLFPEKTYIGLNPFTGRKIYIYDKDFSYFIKKHVTDGSLDIQDLVTVNTILDYDMAFIADDGNSYSFVKQAERKNGAYDIVLKYINDEEEIFHFNYKSKKSAAKNIKRLKKKMSLLDVRNKNILTYLDLNDLISVEKDN